VEEQRTQDGSVQSVDRALQILNLLADAESLGVSEISRILGVHRSTAFRLLATLEAHNYVVQEAHRGTYRLGFGVLRLSGQVAAHTDFIKEAKLVCDEIAGEVNETSNVAILDHGAAVNISQTTSTRLVSVTHQFVGQRNPLHATSTGKVLLANGPADLLRSTLSGELESFTPHTITTATTLETHLEQVRARGWAAAIEEWELDTNAIAVPVHNPAGKVVAALSVTAPSFRMTPERFPVLVEMLRRHAQNLGTRAGSVAPNAA
jgi:DNA-binding IclR family transcriptional regulator